MASVTGKTSLKLDELIGDNIIDGEIVDDHLILRTRAGAEIDAGLMAAAPTPLASMPIGYIYMSVDSTDPGTLFGGSWTRISQGRVLVGQDPAQTEFDTVGETGGEKTHVLTSGELPAHTHAIDHDHASFTSGSGGNHTHAITRKSGAGTATGVTRGNSSAEADGTTVADGSHTHAIDPPAYTGSSGSTGSGTAHNNLQPYLVVYMWKRAA